MKGENIRGDHPSWKSGWFRRLSSIPTKFSGILRASSIGQRPIFVCFLWSLFFHVALFSTVLATWRVFEGRRPADRSDELLGRMSAALRPPGGPAGTSVANPPNSEKPFESIFDFSAGFKADDKEMFLKEFGNGAAPEAGALAQLKQLAEGKSIPFSSQEKVRLFHDNLNNAFELDKLKGRKEEELDRVMEDGGRDESRPLTRNHNVRIEMKDFLGKSIVDIPDEIYFRTCPYKSILFHGASLFSIHRRPFDPDRQAAPRTGDSPSPAAGGSLHAVLFINLGMAHPLSEKKRKIPAASAFPLGPKEKAAYLDGLMSLTEVDQLAAFNRAFLNNHDPEDPNLAEFIHEFVYSNLNSVFVGINDVSLAFDYLEEIYYKRPIYDFYLSYWNQYPHTQTAREFLFSLAGAYEFEKRALTTVFAAYAKAKAVLNDGKSYNLYQEKAKSFVIREIVDDLWAKNERHPNQSLEEAVRRYDKIILAMYDLLGRRKDELGCRALFMKGRFLWDHNDPKEAAAVWRAIPMDYDNTAFQSIRPYLGLETKDSRTFRRGVADSLNPRTADDAGLLSRLLKYHKWSMRAKNRR